MNLYRVIVPIILLLIVIAIVGFVIVYVYRRFRTEEQEKEERDAYFDSDVICGVKNPRTGWVCERWNNHPGNHKQEIHGEMYDWPDDD